MSDSEDAARAARKRVNDRQLTKDDDPDELVNTGETEGHWKQASTEEISKRRILKGKRSGGLQPENMPKAAAEAKAPEEPKAAEAAKPDEAKAAEKKDEEKKDAAEKKGDDAAKAPEAEKKDAAAAAAAPKPAFSFGNPGAPVSFGTFGAAAPAGGAAPAFAFNFGAAAAGAAPGGLFSFTGVPGSTGFAPAPSADGEGGDGDENPEAEVAIEVTGKTQVLSKEQLKTGEEDEDLLLEVSPAKLYKLGYAETLKPEERKGAAKQWLERGRGAVRLLVNKETGKARLLMRAEVVLKILLNVAVWKGMTCEESGAGKAIIFTAAESEDGAPVVNSYTLRVATKEAAQQLIQKVRSLVEKLKKDA